MQQLNKCIYCGLIGAVTSANLYVCGDEICRAKYLLEPSTNAVINCFKRNAPELEFLIKMSFATALSPRRDMIFNPFPWNFKKADDNQFARDTLGEPAPKNRDYDALLTCMRIATADQIMELCVASESDLDLLSALVNLDSQSGLRLYQFIKFIVETKNIETEYLEMHIEDKTTKVYKQFKIKHQPAIESAFMRSSSVFCHLFHGSAIENWHSIIRNGIFSASGTKLMTAGAAYGHGVYLSDNLLISGKYVSGNLNMDVNVNVNINTKIRRCQHGSDMVIAVFQIAAAKETYQKTASIFVVPDSSKLLLRYLIVIPRGGDLAALSAGLEKMCTRAAQSDARVVARVSTRTQSRINRDIKLLSSLSNTPVEEATDFHTVKILHNRITINIRIKFTEEYPFEPPLMWISSPIIRAPVVLPSGAISMAELLRAGWKATANIVEIIKTLLLSGVEKVAEGQYDDNRAKADALAIRG